MSIDIRLPNISGTDHEKVEQIRSYLYQFAEQLNWALNNLDSTVSTAVSQATKTPSVAEAEAERQKNFSSIKALIIKSSDIVEAYSDEINRRLEGVYVAESEFGEYKETTSNEIKANSDSIISLIDKIGEINTSIEGIDTQYIKDVKAHIKAGELAEENGSPVMGIEVGQTDTNIKDGETISTYTRYARFTADRLSFFDQNDYEVAYISKFKLHITNADISESLQIGNFVLDTTKGLTLKWEEVTE